MMAACRGIVPVASDFGLLAGGRIVRNQAGGIPASTLRLRIAPRARRVSNLRRYSTSLRTMKSSSVRAIADVASDSSAVASEEEMLRKADSYFATDSRPIVLFDGVCNFCNTGVNFVLDNDSEGRVRMAALQSEAGRALLLRAGRASDDLSSLVLVEKDRSYIKSEGVLRTAQYLGNVLPPLGTVGLLFPLFFRDFVYDNVANNRYSILGRRDQCRVSDSRFADRFVV